MTDKILTAEQVAEIQARHESDAEWAGETLKWDDCKRDRAALLESHEVLLSRVGEWQAWTEKAQADRDKYHRQTRELRAELDAANAEIERLEHGRPAFT